MLAPLDPFTVTPWLVDLLTAMAFGLPLLCLGGAYRQTPEAERLAADIAAAIAATVYVKDGVLVQLTHKVVADIIGVTKADLSHMLAARKPLNILRFASPEMPPEFWDALLEVRALQRGGLYVKPAVVALLKVVQPKMVKMAARAAERKLA